MELGTPFAGLGDDQACPMSVDTNRMSVDPRSARPGTVSMQGTGKSSKAAGSPAGFSFGQVTLGKRLGLRTRLVSSLTGHHQDSPAGSKHADSPGFAFRAAEPSDTPSFFMRQQGRLAQSEQSPARQQKLLGSPGSVDRAATTADSCSVVLRDPALLALVLQWLDPLELHEVARLAPTFRTAAAVVKSGVLAVTDIDFSWRGKTAADGHESAENIAAALKSLSDDQLASVRRLLTTPDLLTCPPETFDRLQDCPNLAFLCLTLQGTDMDMFSGVADHWPNLPSLTSRLHALVCLDLSACLMQDSHLQAIAPHCGGLRALDLSYNPMLTSEGVLALLRVCRGLEELDLSSCPDAQTEEVARALSLCPGLTSLFMERDAPWLETTCGAQDTEQHHMSAGTLQALVDSCSQLQMLSLSGQPLMQSSSYVDSVSTQLLTRLPHLTSLNVTQCEGCGAADLAAHLAQQPHANLSSLQLTIDTDATHDQLATIVEGCPSLDSLTLTGAVDMSRLESMAGSLRDLRASLRVCVSATQDVECSPAAHQPSPVFQAPSAVKAAPGAANIILNPGPTQLPWYHSPGLYNRMAPRGAAAERLRDVTNQRPQGPQPPLPKPQQRAEPQPQPQPQGAPEAADFKTLLSFLRQSSLQ